MAVADVVAVGGAFSRRGGDPARWAGSPRRSSADIGDIAAHGQLLDEAEAALGPLTTLVNNAGVSVLSRGDLLDVTPESYDRCLAINTRGTFFLTQAFARRVLADRPHGPSQHRDRVLGQCRWRPRSRAANIAFPRPAASMITKLFAARLSNDGIGVYEIQPGFIETDMTAPSKAKYDALIEGGLTVIKRFGTPAEVGRIARRWRQGFCPIRRARSSRPMAAS